MGQRQGETTEVARGPIDYASIMTISINTMALYGSRTEALFGVAILLPMYGPLRAENRKLT